MRVKDAPDLSKASGDATWHLAPKTHRVNHGWLHFLEQIEQSHGARERPPSALPT
jgi:hypothetical protein